MDSGPRSAALPARFSAPSGRLDHPQRAFQVAGTPFRIFSTAVAAFLGGLGPASPAAQLLYGHHNATAPGFACAFKKLRDIFGRVSVFLQPKQGVTAMPPTIALGLWNRRRRLASGKTPRQKLHTLNWTCPETGRKRRLSFKSKADAEAICEAA